VPSTLWHSLPARKRASAWDPANLDKAGGDFDPALPNNRVLASGANADYIPNWTGPGSTVADLAYATFAFDLDDYGADGSVNQSLKVDWGGGGPGFDEVWVGLAHVARDSWDWFVLDDEVLTIETFTPYTDASGRVLVMVLLLNAGGWELQALNVGAPELRGTGVLPVADSIQEGAPPISSSTPLPASVDLRPNLPPLRNQGEVSSCGGFSTALAYGHQLNVLWKDYGWDKNDKWNMVSPRWIYAPLDTNCPNDGSVLKGCAERIYNSGAGSERFVPYGNGDKAGFDCSSTFNVAAYEDAAQMQPDEFGSVDLTNRDDTKRILSQGYAITFGTKLDFWFHIYQFGVWKLSGAGDPGGHAMCIVGYDDNKDGGAFLVANSWGTAWGEDGFIWIDYDHFVASNLVYTDGHYFKDSRTLAFAQHFGLADAGLNPPRNVNASDGVFTDKVRITWDSNIDADRYEVYRDKQDNKIADVPASANPSYDDFIADGDQHFYWVKAFAGALSADFSSAELGYKAGDPDAQHVTPTSGQRGTVAVMQLDYVSSGPVSYNWQFGNACTPSSSTLPAPSVAFNEVGVHDCSVTITNTLTTQTDTHNFQLVVDNALSVWTRSWGGAGNDTGEDVFVDGAGNVYTVGKSDSFGNGDQLFFTRITAGGELSLARQWGGSNNEEGRGICADAAGNMYITGVAVGDVVVMKLDASGNRIAIKGLESGGGNIDRGNDIALDKDGNVYVTGYWDGSDMLLAKYNSDLDLLWAKRWGGLSGDAGQSLAISPDGSRVYVAGNTSSMGAGSDDLLVVAFNSDGARQWGRTWGTAEYEEGAEIALGGSGNIYVATTIDAGHSGSKMAVVCYSPAGVKNWQRDYIGPGLGADTQMRLRGLGADAADNVYALGYNHDPHGGLFNHILRKYDSLGNSVWTRKRLDEATTSLLGSAMCSAAGKLMITGTAGNGNWLQFQDMGGGTASDSTGVDAETAFDTVDAGAAEWLTPSLPSDAAGTFKTGGGSADVLIINYNPNTNDPTGI
jgi:hypothetical protein